MPRSLSQSSAFIRILAGADSFSISPDGSTIDIKEIEERFTGFSGVHFHSDTSVFFDETLRPIVESIRAGQSHTILFCGPPSSGRSQTMYDVAGPGVVHLMARALLQSADAQHVTYAGWYTSGHQIRDSIDESIPDIQSLPQPFGLTPITRTRMLTTPSSAVLVPRGKTNKSSCFIQFQIETRLGNSGRSASASITFVDLATISNEMLRDDMAVLERTVKEILRGADGSETAQESQLTRFLHSSMRGTLVTTIACVIGSSKLVRETVTTLRLAKLLSSLEPPSLRIAQVITPPWLHQVLPSLHQLVEEQKTNEKEAQAGGMADAYNAIRQFIQKHFGGKSLRDLISENRQQQSVRLSELLEAGQAASTEADTFLNKIKELQESTKRLEGNAAMEQAALEMLLKRGRDESERTSQDIQRVQQSKNALKTQTAELKKCCARAKRRAARHSQPFLRDESSFKIHSQLMHVEALRLEKSLKNRQHLLSRVLNEACAQAGREASRFREAHQQSQVSHSRSRQWKNHL